MIPGASEKARWIRSGPRRVLPAAVLERIVRAAVPDGRVIHAEPLADGLRNTNVKVTLDRAPDRIVVRIYEHDASLCQKEVDLLRLVRGSVPVPEVIHAEPDGRGDLPPFAVMRFVDGITFRDLARTRDERAIAEAARSVGEALAMIGRTTFARAGWIGPGPDVGASILPVGPMPRFVSLHLESTILQERMPESLRSRVNALVSAAAPTLADLENDSHLVHGDFSRRNILVRPIDGRWSVAAILDWELAVSTSPLADLATFLRYDRATRPLAEPHFSTGYVDGGGALPPNWRQLARCLDLAAICDALARPELPAPVAIELLTLAQATVDHAVASPVP